MRTFIIQSQTRTPQDTVSGSEQTSQDNAIGGVYSRNLRFQLDAHDAVKYKPANSHAKVVVGHTIDGLPFIFTAHAPSTSDKKLFDLFIDTHLVPLMTEYSRELALKDERVTNSFISNLNSLRREHAPDLELSLSLAMTYIKGGRCFCSGFGFGLTGLVMKRAYGQIEELVSVSELVQRSSSMGVEYLESVASNESVFNIEVTSGDEIIGFADLPSGLISTTKEEPCIFGKDTVRYYLFDLKTRSGSLFHQLKVEVADIHQQMISTARARESKQLQGNDFMMGRLVIPSQKSIFHLKHKYFFELILKGIERFMQTKENRIYEFFNSVSQTKGRAECYQELFKVNKGDGLHGLLILRVMFDNAQDDDLTKFLTEFLEPYQVSLRTYVNTAYRQYLGLNKKGHYDDEIKQFRQEVNNTLNDHQTGSVASLDV